MSLDPTLAAEIKRRSNERLCEKLKRKYHDKQWANYPEDEREMVECRHARFLTCTEWYEWETNEWYLEEQELPDVVGGMSVPKEETRSLTPTREQRTNASTGKWNKIGSAQKERETGGLDTAMTVAPGRLRAILA